MRGYHRLQSCSDVSWKIIPEAVLAKFGGLSFLTNCNYDISSLQINNLPSFYREILTFWQNAKVAFENPTSPQDEIIWNNKNIRINEKPLFFKRWFDKGIIFVKDLLNADKKFIPFTPFFLFLFLLSYHTE